MTMLDTGTYGAKVQSWRRANPRDRLKQLMDENPKADKAALFALFRDELRSPDAEEYLDSVVEYWFANNYHSLVERPAPLREQAERQKRASVAAVKNKVVKRIRHEAQIILLDMVLPNGKALRDCKGSDCTKLGKKVGGWLAKIGAKVKPNEVVGDVLDESEIRKLYGR